MLYTREDGGLIGDACRWLYSIAVRLHAWWHFGDRSLGTRTPMNCEAVGGPQDCYCTNPPTVERMRSYRCNRLRFHLLVLPRWDFLITIGPWHGRVIFERNPIGLFGNGSRRWSGWSRWEDDIDNMMHTEWAPAPFTGTPYDPGAEED